jgi:hypothetical protein
VTVISLLKDVSDGEPAVVLAGVVYFGLVPVGFVRVVLGSVLTFQGFWLLICFAVGISVGRDGLCFVTVVVGAFRFISLCCFIAF